MNLKESFRYQNFLDKLMLSAGHSLVANEHCLSVTKTHLRHKANPEAEDMTEVVDNGDFCPNDGVIQFMLRLISEREKLTAAINRAKSGVGFDIDAAIEANKFRQNVATSIKSMLSMTGSKRTEQGSSYTFNAEKNQTQYFYDIEVVSSELFDRAGAKETMRQLRAQADQDSAKIDAAMVNTTVKYDPPFNVNDSFEDVMEVFTNSAQQ